MAFERLVVTSLDLIGEQQRQERGVIQLLSTSQRQPLRQRRHQLPELQALEQARQIWIEGMRHASTSTAATDVPCSV
jgi:hypothetical protein